MEILICQLNNINVFFMEDLESLTDFNMELKNILEIFYEKVTNFSESVFQQSKNDYLIHSKLLNLNFINNNLYF